jgi:xanthine dehydrogenase YagS FAD-binding subunit
VKEFTFRQSTSLADASVAADEHPGAMFLAGGTTLVDLMKVDVLTPDIRSLPISIEKVLGHASASPRTGSSLEELAATTARARHDAF